VNGSRVRLDRNFGSVALDFDGIEGLAAQTRITGGEGNNDTLRLQTLGGDDRLTTVNDISDLLTPVINPGADE
jgi:hypothetical protein